MVDKYPNLIDRFLRYVKINTRSNELSKTRPSDPREVEFLKNLAIELEGIGAKNVRTMKDSYVFAELEATKGKENIAPIGFLAHVDTADFNAENIKPQIVEDYDGESIIRLNDEYQLDPKTFPNLKNYKGATLITTDGTTLLGADDKAGVAEIISAIEFIVDNPTFAHGPLKFAFGPDEETGFGADNFDVENFGADFAYTMDGGPVGQLEWETFNGAGALITAKGVTVHPGEAYGKLINPIQLLIELDTSLPNQRPENTKDREGYYYLISIEGDVDSAQARYIIRDHDRGIFEKRKKVLSDSVDALNEKYGAKYLSLELNDQYYNMGEVIKNDMHPVELAEAAMRELDITPLMEPIRGGTDGSKITFLGLPTPNIFAGGENMHGRFEYVSEQSMEKATEVILKIIELQAK